MDGMPGIFRGCAVVMIPEDRQGLLLEGVRPMSLRILMIRLYQYWGNCLSPYSVFLRIQKSSGLEPGQPRGG